MRVIGIEDPVRGAQELAVFQNHLDDMTIHVPLCALAMVKGQHKDVH
jgi:hypothetical protein